MQHLNYCTLYVFLRSTLGPTREGEKVKNIRKETLPEITIIPPSVARDAGRFTQHNEIEREKFFSKLTLSKQQQLLTDIEQLTAARMMHVSSGLAMGKYFSSIHAICEPHSGAFRKIANSFKFTGRTAYRYMETYENVRSAFHETILKAMMVRGVNILSYSKEAPLGKYTEVVRLLPPPANPDEHEASRYVDQIEQTYKDRKKVMSERGERETPVVTHTKKDLLESNYRGIRNALKSLPLRQRRPFLDELFGMALTELGIGSNTTFTPEAIPEDFRRGPGYPRGRPRTYPDKAVA